MSALPPDAVTFLHALGGRFAFQTFDERGKDRGLSRVLHGALAEHADTLTSLNARGAGVFVMVNEGDGKGRCTANVQRIRAYFIDSDEAPITSLLTAFSLPPHMVVESSPGLGHAYWLVDGAELDTFRAVQLALAARYGTDTAPHDLPRVMRVPGFLHCKGKPFLTRIMQQHDAQPYTHAAFVYAFGIDLQAGASLIKNQRIQTATVTPLPKRTLARVIPEGERNPQLFDLACGLVRQGLGTLAVNDRMQRINAERARPPLCASEVDSIVTQAVAYGSDGYMQLPHAVWDGLQAHAVPSPVRLIVLTVYRQFNGFNNCNISLAWADCKGIPGCSDAGAFYRYRTQAIATGFIVVAQKGRHTQTGRRPDLFAIPDQYLPVSQTRQNTQLAQTRQNTQSYIDKQLLAAKAQIQGKRASGANK